MVNLVAGRKVVPELMQKDATGERLAEEAAVLLENAGSREEMKRELQSIASTLATANDPIENAAHIVNEYLRTK
jgi:lipid-A-disaccharide synthase